MKGHSGVIRPLWPQKRMWRRGKAASKSSHLVTLTAPRTLQACGACRLQGQGHRGLGFPPKENNSQGGEEQKQTYALKGHCETSPEAGVWEWRANMAGDETTFISVAPLTDHHCRVAKSNIIYSLAVLGGERPVSRSFLLESSGGKSVPSLSPSFWLYPSVLLLRYFPRLAYALQLAHTCKG